MGRPGVLIPSSALDHSARVSFRSRILKSGGMLIIRNHPLLHRLLRQQFINHNSATKRILVHSGTKKPLSAGSPFGNPVDISSTQAVVIALHSSRMVWSGGFRESSGDGLRTPADRTSRNKTNIPVNAAGHQVRFPSSKQESFCF
jgi:hypothetical protein